MKYNFDEIVERRNTNSYKWDSSSEDDILPLWVADMDFRTAPAIIDALTKRALHGVFGYTKVPEAYYNAVIDWFGNRYGFIFEKQHMLFTTGVVPALSAVIKALTGPGDKVIVQTPVYNCFFSSIRNNQCEIVANELKYENGTYNVNFSDLEQKAADPKVKLLLLCNPHNPVGRVWTRRELELIGEICLRNNVIVVADEIHCDLVYPGHKYVPFASVSNAFLQNSVTCTAPSKTFNLAGIQVANIIATNDNMRVKIDKALNVNEVCEINAFAVEAVIASYNNGHDWLEELKIYLHENYLTLIAYFKEYLPHLKVLPLEATYLVWVDCSALGITSKEIAGRLRSEEKICVNEGTMYGDSGEGFIRINIATRRDLLLQGLEKIRKLFGR